MTISIAQIFTIVVEVGNRPKLLVFSKVEGFSVCVGSVLSFGHVFAVLIYYNMFVRSIEMLSLYVLFLVGCGTNTLPETIREGITIQSSTTSSLVISQHDIVHVQEKPHEMGCQWSIQLTKQGSATFSKMTSTVGKPVHVYLFEDVIASPNIMEPITGGVCVLQWTESCAQVHKKYAKKRK